MDEVNILELFFSYSNNRVFFFVAPTEKMRSILERTIQEAKDKISKKLVQADQCVTCDQINEALQQLKGAVMIVYPMNLPPYDPIELEFKNQEELEGTQDSLDVIPESDMSIWFSGKEMQLGKVLSDFVGKNEKTKVIVKIQKKGNAAPARERVVSDDEQKQMMAYYYRKQQDLKVCSKKKQEISFRLTLSFRKSKKMKIIHTWIRNGRIEMH